MEKLKNLGTILTGNTPTTSDYNNYSSDDIYFVKPSDISGNGLTRLSSSEFCISEYARKKARILPANSVLITCIGIIGKVALNTVECAFNQQINAVIPNENKCVPEYIAYALIHRSPQLRATANSAVVPIINKTQFAEIDIPVPSLETQKRIVRILQKIERMISLYEKQLRNLDDLIKARFVEMFGDPVHNTAGLNVLPMTEVCEIIDGDRGKSYPKADEFFDEEYCLFLNAKNVTNHGFDFSECMFITKEKDKSLRKGKLNRGDVVLTTRGTLGNLAYYNDDVPYENVRINSGMVILRMNRQIIDEGFFIEQFRMQVDDIKKSVASGSAQPQLPISTMNKISMIMPNLNEQKQFSAFVEQVGKSKLAAQKALDETQTLFDSLMQQYFGS